MNLFSSGFLVIINRQGITKGIFTDGDLKRLMQKKREINNFKIKKFMTKKPFIVEKNMLISDILSLMNKKKITSLLCSSEEDYKKNKLNFKLKGIVQMHSAIKVQ